MQKTPGVEMCGLRPEPRVPPTAKFRGAFTEDFFWDSIGMQKGTKL
jgi:hypothetical protein